MKKIVVVALFVGLAGCSKKPSASEVCSKLEAEGVAAGCHEEKPLGLGAAAAERFDFSLPSVPGKSGSVYTFAKQDTFKTTVDSYERAALLAGPHRYGSEKALVFVQVNSGASLETGKKIKGIVEAL